VAGQVAEAAQQRRELERWTEHRRNLSDRVVAAGKGLAGALQSRGVPAGDNVAISLKTYLSACAERARVAASARLRGELERELAAKQASEEAWKRATDAERSLREVAANCSIGGENNDALYEGLKAWQARHAEMLLERQAARDEWTELQTLLAGKTLDEMGAEAARKGNLAERLASGLDAAEVSDALQIGDLDERLARLRRDVEEAVNAAGHVSGQMEDRARRLISVAEAEEDVARSQQELDRVRRLGRTVELSQQFLERAQERVHRDIAPVLAQTVKRWLPEVTMGRFSDAIVDPETLMVQVRDPQGRWRDAALLSHGTSEQIYLLLRVALAQHLGKPGETCPLILDEVTVQCDRVRTEAIMRCLHAISRERQVIVFTQQQEVLAWAQDHLDGSSDRLIQLPGPGATA
jgi:uncharacterized protein YhaN